MTTQHLPDLDQLDLDQLVTEDPRRLTIGTPQLARLLGVDARTLRTAASTGRGITIGGHPVHPVKVGAQYLWPRLVILRTLGLAPVEPDPADLDEPVGRLSR